jgi:hypothetical protein
MSNQPDPGPGDKPKDEAAPADKPKDEAAPADKPKDEADQTLGPLTLSEVVTIVTALEYFITPQPTRKRMAEITQDADVLTPGGIRTLINRIGIENRRRIKIGDVLVYVPEHPASTTQHEHRWHFVVVLPNDALGLGSGRLRVMAGDGWETYARRSELKDRAAFLARYGATRQEVKT